jgi:hypothetical protein
LERWNNFIVKVGKTNEYNINGFANLQEDCYIRNLIFVEQELSGHIYCLSTALRFLDEKLTQSYYTWSLIAIKFIEVVRYLPVIRAFNILREFKIIKLGLEKVYGRK